MYLFPDFSELITVMKGVIIELQNSQKVMENLGERIDKLIEALEV